MPPVMIPPFLTSGRPNSLFECRIRDFTLSLFIVCDVKIWIGHGNGESKHNRINGRHKYGLFISGNVQGEGFLAGLLTHVRQEWEREKSIKIKI